MSLSGEDLTKINGADAVEDLRRVRAERAANAAARKSAVEGRLGAVASPAGVVDPEDSLEAHSGQVPAVAAELPADTPDSTESVPADALATEAADATITDGWDPTVRPTEFPSPAEYDRDNGIERAGATPVPEGHPVNTGDAQEPKQ